MQTKRLDANRPADVTRAAQLLRDGLLVAFPTDTVYGVGADAFQPAAVERLYQVKHRPYSKGIPILLADVEDLDKVAHKVPPLARQLAAAFWPGPLTLVVPRVETLPDLISPNMSVAVRIPDHDECRSLIRAAGGAVAASSANRSGEAPAKNAAEALSALEGSIAAVLDGGHVHLGQASTVVDCTVSPYRLLRQGPIAAEGVAHLLPNPQ